MHTVPYLTIPYLTISPFRVLPYHTVPYHTISYCTLPPCHTVPYNIDKYIQNIHYCIIINLYTCTQIDCTCIDTYTLGHTCTILAKCWGKVSLPKSHAHHYSWDARSTPTLHGRPGLPNPSAGARWPERCISLRIWCR